jgi:hypothetical protein
MSTLLKNFLGIDQEENLNILSNFVENLEEESGIIRSPFNK